MQEILIAQKGQENCVQVSSKYGIFDFNFSNHASFLLFLARLQEQLFILLGFSLQERPGFTPTCHTAKEGAINNLKFGFRGSF